MPKRLAKRRRPAPRGLATEGGRPSTLSVVWLLAGANTLLCLVGAVVGQFFLVARPLDAPLRLITDLFLYGSLLLGSGTLVLTVLVIRRRKEQSPWPAVMASLLVGLAPWALIMLQAA